MSGAQSLNKATATLFTSEENLDGIGLQQVTGETFIPAYMRNGGGEE